MSEQIHPRGFVISGPSGAGKSTIIHGAMAQIPAIRMSVSFTTRGRRDGEEDGRHYNFIDRETFQRMIAEGEFLEWAQVFDNYYGTGRSAVQELLARGHHVVLDVDTTGAMNIRKIAGGVVFIFIRPPSLAELEARLRGRGSETEETLAKRLARAESELALSGRYDHILVNDDADRAIGELVAIIRAEQGRDVPFTVTPSAAPGSRDAPGAGSPEALVQALTGRLGPAMRAELVKLVSEHVRAVMERDLPELMREAYQSHRKGS